MVRYYNPEPGFFVKCRRRGTELTAEYTGAQLFFPTALMFCRLKDRVFPLRLRGIEGFSGGGSGHRIR
jgi:hypothetical protein